VDRRVTKERRHAGWALALVPLVLVLAGCGSGGGGSSGTTTTSPDAALESHGTTVQSAMTSYRTKVAGCAKESNPVVCLENADRELGDQIHAYANVLATGHAFTAKRADLSTTLNEAQLLANSLEILGDAQPTQANYDQVRNTFNINSAITQLQADVATLARSPRK
jgi:hypothetical protein